MVVRRRGGRQQEALTAIDYGDNGRTTSMVVRRCGGRRQMAAAAIDDGNGGCTTLMVVRSVNVVKRERVRIK